MTEKTERRVNVVLLFIVLISMTHLSFSVLCRVVDLYKKKNNSFLSRYSFFSTKKGNSR